MKKLFVSILCSLLISASFSQTLKPPYEYQPDANTVLLLHMNETSGSTVSDVSNYSNNGMATGTTIVDGRFGKARNFNGASNYVDIPHSSSLAFSNSITTEAWISVSSGEGRIVSKGWTTGNEFYTEANKVAFTAVNNGSVQSMSLKSRLILNFNQWYHVAFTYDGATAKIYINGQLDTSKSATGTLPQSTNILRVGLNSVNGLDDFAGLIDEVRISNIARSPQEFNLQLPPVNLTATSSGTTVNLSWQNGGGAVPLMRYKIYRGTDSTNVSLVDSTATTSKTNTVAGGGNYYYRISAVDSTGFEGAKSWAVSASPVAPVTYADIAAGLQGVTYYTSVAWGDYDNDGKLDVAVCGRLGATLNSITKIYHNNGNGTFTDISANLIGVFDGSVTWGDYDGDGDLDLLVCGYAGSGGSGYLGVTKIYRNNGNGSFTDINAPFTGVYFGQAQFVDYNNDGRLDVCVTGDSTQNPFNPITNLYRNNGDGTFTEVSTNLPAIGGLQAWGDFNNDGLQDVVLTGGTSTVNYYSKLFKNIGNGQFSEISGPPFDGANRGAAWGDFNGDGFLDLLIYGSNGPSPGYSAIAKIYRNNGDGTFTDINAGLAGFFDAGAAWGDFDGDGDLDIVITGSLSGTSASQYTKLYRNDGGVFNEVSTAIIGVTTSSVAWGDYNNDGRLDVLIAGTDISRIYQSSGGYPNTSPLSPTNLTHQVNGSDVKLGWSKSTDNETAQNGLTYNLRVGTTRNGMEVMPAMSDLGNGFHRVSVLGNVDQVTSWTMRNVTAGKYYWSVQAIDNSFAGSAFSAVDSFIVGRADGLVAWYPFNGTPNDSSGNGNNGLNNGATPTTDRFGNAGKAYSFNGSSSYISVPDSSSLQISGNITICAWVKTSNIQISKSIVEKYYSGTLSDHGWLLNTSANGRLLMEGRDGRGGGGTIQCFGDSNYANNQWHFVIGQRSGNIWSVYLDGILSDSVNIGGTAGSIESGGKMTIGAFSNANPVTGIWQGSIDDIRIYNRALSAKEIDSLYHEGSWNSTAINWSLQVQASSAGVVDNENYLGVSNAATDTLDQLFDVPKPPLPQGSYVQVYFPHPEWGSILGNNFARDIKKNASLADTVKRWYFQVKSNVVNDTVALTFVNDRIPSAFGKYLTDLKTGKRVNLRNTSLYKYFNTSDTARSFILIIGDTTAPSLALISPNGSNTWRSGTTKNITWSMSDGTGIDSVFIYSSSNGGGSYSLLKSLGPVQSTSWVVPNEYLNNNYSIKIISRDSLGNQSTTRSAKTFTVVGDSLATVNSAGWSLISSPLTPNDSSIANIFGSSSYIWYYTQATGYTQPSRIALGNGYWLGVTAAKNWFVKGTASEADSSMQNLQIGYNIIGNNFVRNVSKSNLYFLKSGSYYNFNSAVTAGLISNTLYGYSSSAYTSTDTMSLFGGYWIGVLQSGVQLIQKPSVSIVTPLAKQTQIYAMNWDLPISVSTPSLADNIAAIGIKPTSSVDFDPLYDAPRPPRNPGSKYLELYFTNTGGNYPAILGSKYAKDYRGSNNPQWSFTVECSNQELVTLQWDSNVLKQLGGNVRLALTDQSTSTSIDMATQTNYSFNYSSLRSFTITSTITGVDDNSENKPTSYALSQNFPNPFNPSTQIEFSIPHSSHVTLKIYNVLGKEVVSLVDGAMGIGTYTITWNAQNCPSGVYFYRLTAGSYTMTRKLLLLR